MDQKHVLTTEQQELIVVALEQCSKMGWPCGDDEVKQIVKSFLDSTGQETCFVNNTHGKDWMISFRRRWSERVSMRKAEILSKKRAENFNEETLNNFFEIYKTVLGDSGILEADDAAARIFKDYLRYVSKYSLFDPNIAIIYEKDNLYKHFSGLFTYSRLFFWPSLLNLPFSDNTCADRGLTKIINMRLKDNLCK